MKSFCMLVIFSLKWPQSPHFKQIWRFQSSNVLTFGVIGWKLFYFVTRQWKISVFRFQHSESESLKVRLRHRLTIYRSLMAPYRLYNTMKHITALWKKLTCEAMRLWVNLLMIRICLALRSWLYSLVICDKFTPWHCTRSSAITLLHLRFYSISLCI